MTAFAILVPVMLGLHLLTPYWWWVMAVPFLYGATAARTGGRAFLTGLASAGTLWLGAGLFFFLTGSRLVAARMAVLFKLGDAWWLVPAAGLVAGLAGGIAGYAGHAAGRLFRAPAGKERS